MIEVKGLTKKYGSNLAVSDLSFTVRSGQVYGFLGPNGAGKSTTMNIITGCLAATSGEVLIDGHDIFEEPVKAKRCIGYLPEIPPLYPELTPYEYLSFVGRARGLKGEALKKDIDRVCGLCGLDDVRNRLIRNLSKGYKQRVGIAQAIIGDPDIIILDEPTVGLDPIQIIEIRQLIKELGSSHTVILSSHILSEVSAVCDEILIISKGRIVACDTPENLSDAFADSATLELQVRSGAESVRNALSGLDAVKDIRISDDGKGVLDCSITFASDEDPREAVFYALQNAKCSVLSMNLNKPSLEDVFLRLTSAEIPEEVQEKLRNSAGMRGADSEEEPAPAEDAQEEATEE